MFIIGVFLDPMVQLLVWGSLTTITFVYTLVRAFDDNVEDDYRYWRVGIAGLISAFWVVGAFMWFAQCVQWMFISDGSLTIIFFILYKRFQQSWLLTLVKLGFGFLFMDLLNLFGLPFMFFAITSNVIFARELYVVSGKNQSK